MFFNCCILFLWISFSPPICWPLMWAVTTCKMWAFPTGRFVTVSTLNISPPCEQPCELFMATLKQTACVCALCSKAETSAKTRNQLHHLFLGRSSYQAKNPNVQNPTAVEARRSIMECVYIFCVYASVWMCLCYRWGRPWEWMLKERKSRKKDITDMKISQLNSRTFVSCLSGSLFKGQRNKQDMSTALHSWDR